MMPFTPNDLIRLVAERARSALPTAPVRLDPVQPARSVRLDQVRLGIGLALRRLADRIEPACHPRRPSKVDANSRSA